MTIKRRFSTGSETLFNECIEVETYEDGTIDIRCKLGLWSVFGMNREVVVANAMHYWAQYYQDGEYDKMLHKEPNNS